MFISREDLQVFYEQIYGHTARKLGIADFEWKSAKELEADIYSIRSDVSGALNTFIKAYDEWFETHVSIDRSDTSGNLTPEQNERLNQAISKRDSTRNALLDLLNSGNTGEYQI